MLVAFIATGAWAQQAETTEKPAQDEITTVAIAPDNAQQLSEKDKLLACPANMPPNADRRPSAEEESVYKVGGSVKPPKVTNHVAASFSDEARKMAKKKHLKSFQAISLITLIVDAQGNPQNACVMKSAGYGLDGEAVKAVNKYRFEPATKEDGTPVPVSITVEVNFRLY
jgi:TonB family protein